jgi:ferredoxin
VKVRVDSSKCSGHGMCFGSASEVYQLDDEGFAAVQDVDIDVLTGLEEQARLGALSCPEQAISVSEG